MMTKSGWPKSPDIKRMITAAKNAGVEIGSVDIRHDGITIHPPSKGQGLSAYDKWEAQNAS